MKFYMQQKVARLLWKSATPWVCLRSALAVLGTLQLSIQTQERESVYRDLTEYNGVKSKCYSCECNGCTYTDVQLWPAADAPAANCRQNAPRIRTCSLAQTGTSGRSDRDWPTSVLESSVRITNGKRSNGLTIGQSNEFKFTYKIGFVGRGRRSTQRPGAP